MIRKDIINHLIDKYHYESYLEIGLNTPHMNYFWINCKYKECVDPYDNNSGMDLDFSSDVKEYIENYILTYKMTSDDFFNTIDENKKYDIIFIDGLHTEEQVGRDIINSFKHLNKGGRIVVHDCLPESEIAQLEERKQVEWNGSVWKAIPQLGKQNIKYEVIDTDWGVGILSIDDNVDVDSLYYPEKSDYDYNNVFTSISIRNIVMHVISEFEFLQE